LILTLSLQKLGALIGLASIRIIGAYIYPAKLMESLIITSSDIQY
jgi:hypothetical protein